MSIWLTEEQTRLIIQHAITEKPHEACGIIGGRENVAYQIIPARNVAPDPVHHYRIDEQTLSEAWFSLQKSGFSVLGFYHSHPEGDFRPSDTDVAQAFYPDTAYLIVGLKNNVPRLAAWRITYGEVTPIEIYTGIQPPDPEDEQSMSSAQKSAIIASLVIGFAFMIILSLSLLPPAPVIP